MKRCSRCRERPARRSHPYCSPCHAEYMREWRATHPLTEAQRRKDNARSYAGTYLRRGLIERWPCEHCGAEVAEMHHDDYDEPLDVRWLCRSCHLAEHRSEAESPDGDVRNVERGTLRDPTAWRDLVARLLVNEGAI